MMSLLPYRKKRAVSSTVLSFCLLLLFSACLPLAAADSDNEKTTGEQYYTVRMGGSLWNTLIDNGADPTQWRSVFEFNREHNPAFRKIRSANRIPRGVTIYIPLGLRQRRPIQPPQNGAAQNKRGPGHGFILRAVAIS